MTSRLTVDLGALAANYRTLRAAAGAVECGAVVKADGYGLGAVPVAQRLRAEGCRHFFVATAAEATALRPALPAEALYVLSGPTCDNVAELTAAAVIPVLNSATQLDCWRPRRGPVAIHVDTGMNRLGFALDDARPERFRGVEIALLMTHFACADEPEHPLNRLQLERFAAVTARFPGVPTSIGNSAATLQGGAWCGDIVRPGIALYGGNPFTGRANRMRAVATLEGDVLQLREVAPGDAVGYGASWVARGARLIATVGAGYADGLPRLLSNVGAGFVHGRRVPYAGRVSMDLTTIDVTDVADAIAVGDPIQLIGAEITIDEIAAHARTMAYEILTGLGRRAERRYIP